MKIASYTPGPWHCNETEHAIDSAHERIALTHHLYHSSLPYDERKANARLIAAAPALRDALQALLEFAEDAANFIQSVDATNADEIGIEGYEPSPEQLAVFEQARAALALISRSASGGDKE